VKPDCDGVYCGVYGSECLKCESRQECEAKRKEIEGFVRKYGTHQILPFLHGAGVALYAEEHLDMKEADEDGQ
jgi:hypothetical protein